MKKCLLCGGSTKIIFRYNKYDIRHCQNCETSFVDNMPSPKELSEYYSGFKFCVNENNLKRIVSPIFDKWFKSFKFPKNPRMLDIGGGGGYFSLAFEKYTGGVATYIDLDDQACEYVKGLGIKNVINMDVNLFSTTSENKYDFIYCRHVIEHLIDPRDIIKSSMNLLSDSGVFVLQFPNGLSFERLVDRKHYLDRIDRLTTNNPQLSRFKMFLLLHSKKTSFGIHPKRHLWSISKKGICQFLDTLNVQYTVETHSIDDPIYSPYTTNLSLIKKILHKIYSIPFGKSHLVIKIRKRSN